MSGLNLRAIFESHYPQAFAVADNPLYQALTGKAYRCSGRPLKPKSPILRSGTKSKTSTILISILLLMTIFPLAFLALFFIPERNNWARTFRTEAQQGRLMDLYLAFHSEEMIDALLAPFVHKYILHYAVTGVILFIVSMLLLVFSSMYLILLGFGWMTALIWMLPAMQTEALFTDITSLINGMREAARHDKEAAAIGHSVGRPFSLLREQMKRQGVAILLTGVLFISALGFSATIFRDNMHSSNHSGWLLILIWTLTPLFCAIVYRLAYFKTIQNRFQLKRQEAIGVANDCLPTILEHYPFLDGS